MVDFVKKYKLLLIILCGIIVIALGVFTAVTIITAPDVDRYEHPDFIGGGQSRGYMRIRLDEAKQNANDDVVLTINTAFCDDIEQAENGMWIRLYYWGSNVFDAVYPGAEKYTMTEEEYFNFDFPTEYEYYILELPDDSVNPKDLQFTTDSDLIRKIMPTVVPYEIHIPLTVREDAPYETSGEVFFYMSYYANGDQINTYTWDDYYGARSMGRIYYYKVGDQIYFSDVSTEDAKALAY